MPGQTRRKCLPDWPHLSRNEVHVVHFTLDNHGMEHLLMPLLDAGERARAQGFVFDRDFRRFVVAHATTRLVLSKYVDVCPAALVFRRTNDGKPSLGEALIDLRFNLSHSGERGLLAVSLAQEVGIDIEEQRPVEALELVQRFFSRAEQRAFMSLTPDEQLPAFFRCWTRKESFIKALGKGLSFPLDAFDVSLEESGSPLLSAQRAGSDARGWQIFSIEVEPGYTAALTTRKIDRIVNCDGSSILRAFTTKANL
jgi:4'-phosphopantetheinyl transferase